MDTEVFFCCIITAWLGVAEHSCLLPGLSSLSQVWISPIGGYWASGGYQAALFGTHLVCFESGPSQGQSAQLRAQTMRC